MPQSQLPDRGDNQPSVENNPVSGKKEFEEYMAPPIRPKTKLLLNSRSNSLPFINSPSEKQIQRRTGFSGNLFVEHPPSPEKKEFPTSARERHHLPQHRSRVRSSVVEEPKLLAQATFFETQ